MPPVGGTEQSQLVTVVVGLINLGVFDTFTGGDATAKAVKHRPGGMGNEVAYTSLASYTDMTVSRVLQADRDWELIRTLFPFAGKVPGSVTIHPLDAEGNPFGNARTARGQYLGIKGIKGDSTSENLQMFEVDFAITSWS